MLAKHANIDFNTMDLDEDEQSLGNGTLGSNPIDGTNTNK